MYLLTLILLNSNLSFLISVDAYQLAADKAISSGSTIFHYVCKCMLITGMLQVTIKELKFRTVFSFCSQLKCWFSGLKLTKCLSE